MACSSQSAENAKTADNQTACLTAPVAPVAITGFGLVTPLANSAWDTFAQLIAGRTTADRLIKLQPDLCPLDVVRAVGGVNIVRHGQDPAVELAERAAREAIFMADSRRPANTTSSDTKPLKTVVLMGSSKGAVHALHAAADKVHRAPLRKDRLAAPPPEDAPLALLLGPHGYLSHHLSRRLNCGPIRQTVAACASSLIALHQGRQLLTQGPADQRPDRVVVVTSEAALLEMFIASYRRLGVIPSLTADNDGNFHYRSRPLDERRDGFILAEMGAAIVLEPLATQGEVSSQSSSSNKSGTLILADTAHAADAYDMIRPDPAMTALSAVAQKLLADKPIDLIHAHATGTLEHDPAELAAYAAHLAHPTDIYAVKGALGHGLGAAGLVSAVLACMCAQTGRRPPMPWLDQPMTTSTLNSDNLQLHKTASAKRDLKRQAIFAAGFGGHVAGAVVEMNRPEAK